MARTLPKNKTEKQKLIIACCQDYYGRHQNDKRANQIALWLMNRRSGVVLTEEENKDMILIKNNLKDQIYCSNLLL